MLNITQRTEPFVYGKPLQEKRMVYGKEQTVESRREHR